MNDGGSRAKARSVLFVGAPRCGAGRVANALRADGLGLYSLPDVCEAARAVDAQVPSAVRGIHEAILSQVSGPASARPGYRWWTGLRFDAAVPVPEGTRETLDRLVRTDSFAWWDPRLVWTLPAWRQRRPDAAVVCVFRDPIGTARAVLEAMERYPVSHWERPTVDDLLEIWATTYRRALHHLDDGTFLFSHQHQLASPDGAGRLGALLDVGEIAAPLRPGSLPEACDVPLELSPLFQELCDRAAMAHATPQRRVRVAAPITVVVPIEEGEQEAARMTLASLVVQRGVNARVIAIDQTIVGDFSMDGVDVIRERCPGRAKAWIAGADAAGTTWVAPCEPGVRCLPDRLSRQVEHLSGREEFELIVGGVLDGSTGRTVLVPPMAERDGCAPGWWSASLVRREALLSVEPYAFYPTELKLLRSLQDGGRVALLDEVVVEAPAARVASLTQRLIDDVGLLDALERPPAAAIEVSVLLACYNRQDVILRCLEGFARQHVSPGALEIIVVDDGSKDASPDLVDALDLAVPLRLVRKENGGAASARNAGLPYVRGLFVLFVNDDTVPFPDTVARHLRAHEELADPRVAVLGTFEQPIHASSNALTRVLEHSALVFGYAHHAPGQVVGPGHFYTCNLSIRSDWMRAAGGFDETYSLFGEDTEIGLRLDRMGVRVVYRPEVRAEHHHVLDVDALRRRQPAAAKATTRLAAQYPEHDLSSVSCTRSYAASLRRTMGPVAPLMERVVRTLADCDVGKLESLPDDGEGRGVAAALLYALDEMASKSNTVWWMEGADRVFEDLGVTGAPEMLARQPVTFASPGVGGALLFWDAQGCWRGVLSRWVASLGAGERREVGIAVPAVVEPDVSDLRFLASLSRRAERAGVSLTTGLVSVPKGNPEFRLLGGAQPWLASEADPRQRFELALRVGVPIWRDPGAGGTVGPVLWVAVFLLDGDGYGFSSVWQQLRPFRGRSDVGIALVFEPDLVHPIDGLVDKLALGLVGDGGGPAVRGLPLSDELIGGLPREIDAWVRPAEVDIPGWEQVTALSSEHEIVAWLERIDAAAAGTPRWRPVEVVRA